MTSHSKKTYCYHQNQVHDCLLYTVVAIGVLTLLADITNNTIISSIRPSWTTVKWATAASFIAAGFLRLNLIHLRIKSHSLASFIVTTMLCGLIGIGQPTNELETVYRHVPSIAVIIGMLAFVGVHIYRGLTAEASVWVSRVGTMLVAMGCICIVGYVFDIRILRFYVAEYSTAMAFLSAVSFICLGQSMRLKP